MICAAFCDGSEQKILNLAVRAVWAGRHDAARFPSETILLKLLSTERASANL